MQNFDLHVHTTYSDGKDTPLETVLFAIDKGMEEIGFSDHSYTAFDESYCIQKERIEKYKQEINELKKRFSEKIKIRCGIEQDAFGTEKTDGYDYVIGSVHYLKKGGKYLPIDESAETTEKIIREHFENAYDWAKLYFEQVEEMVERIRPDIIGHFDLVSKFNENGRLLDEKNPLYVRAYEKCIDKIVKYGIPFEVNTGAVSRGYRTVPYPSQDIMAYLKEKGARFILSSDAHRKENLRYGFEEWGKKYDL